jgi:hypothetical protein
MDRPKKMALGGLKRPPCSTFLERNANNAIFGCPGGR